MHCSTRSHKLRLVQSLENLEFSRTITLHLPNIRTLTFKFNLNILKNLYKEFKDLSLKDLEKNSKNL